MSETNEKKPERVCVKFDLTKDEAERLCALRFEPKPATAAAQVVRMAISRRADDGE